MNVRQDDPNRDGVQSIGSILSKIEELKKDLARLYSAGNSLTNQEVLRVSKELDQAILAYLKWLQAGVSGRPGEQVDKSQ